ncbi:prepilin-type N-terminal cleavage/methylation domain-containing protein [Methylomicrobium album BG8]|uniref:Prepilin-type N-terminal cleavage/methylation domain-containing protein n=2 Tax=Methylococcaceae TaxID=403 RepID=H8GK33_METAL|nr:prepilin-type N-terminal cleavage/methylation domain-containing protein [Methylomicrobium album BG8]
MRASFQGFTLIEAMITMAIIGILASIAYPTYIEHIKKAKRAEAQAALVSLASAMELWKLNSNGVYTDGVNDPTAADILSDQVPVSGGTKIYSLEIATVTASAYTLKATSVDGDRCDALTYTSAGEKGGGEPDCW